MLDALRVIDVIKEEEWIDEAIMKDISDMASCFEFVDLKIPR